MDRTYPPTPFDAELVPALTQLSGGIPSSMDVEQLVSRRAAPRGETAIDDLVGSGYLIRENHAVPGLEGDPDVALSVYKKAEHRVDSPGIYFIHGGGMVSGHHQVVDIVLPWIDAVDAVVVSVGYRLAPEHPDPAPINDCYAGLLWTATHAAELGFASDRLVVAGQSAGGGLAAGTALLARDRNGPALAAQLLICPMIDDRNQTISSHQIQGIGIWDRASNASGWTALLGDRRGTDNVSIYAAPARATDLSGLPPAYLDCGSAEVFRDETVAYASAIWAAGGTADLHVWAGGFHGFDMLAPTAAVSVSARDTRTGFLRRLFQN